MSRRLKQYEVKFNAEGDLVNQETQALSVEGNSIIVTDFYHAGVVDIELFVVATDEQRGQIFSGIMRTGGKVSNLPSNYSNVEFTAKAVNFNDNIESPVLKVFLGSGDYTDDVVVISSDQAIAVKNETADDKVKPIAVEIQDDGGGGAGVAVKNPDPGGIRTPLLVNDAGGRSIPKSSFHDKNTGDATRGTFVTVSGLVNSLPFMNPIGDDDYYNFEFVFNSWHVNPAPQNVFCRVRSARIIGYGNDTVEYKDFSFNRLGEPFDYIIMNAGAGHEAASPWAQSQELSAPSFIGRTIPNLMNWSQKTPSTNGLYTIYQHHGQGGGVNFPRGARTYQLEVDVNAQRQSAFDIALRDTGGDTMIFPAGGKVEVDAPQLTVDGSLVSRVNFNSINFNYAETPVYLTDGMRFGVGFTTGNTFGSGNINQLEVEFDLYITDNPNEAI